MCAMICHLENKGTAAFELGMVSKNETTSMAKAFASYVGQGLCQTPHSSQAPFLSELSVAVCSH